MGALNALKITLGCECKVRAFRLGARMLVVDIIDFAGVPQQVVDAAPMISEQASKKDSKPRIGETAARPRFSFPFITAQQSPSIQLKFTDQPHATLQDMPRNVQSADGVQKQSVSTEQLARKNRMSEAEKRLAEQLSRAASQGLVTPRAAILAKQMSETSAKSTQPSEAKAQEMISSADAPPTQGINLRAQTSADRDFARLLENRPENSNGDPCLTDQDLDLSGWASDAAFGRQIGHLRATLMGEFDRPNPTAARDLARLYIHFGFGAEALQVIRASKLAGEEATLLQTLAEIMEFGHASDSNPLENQFECDSHAALWATLAERVLPKGMKPNAAAILRGVNTLPVHIRAHLGPILADRLVNAEQSDLAAQVLHIVERGLETPDTRFELADAKVQLAKGDIPSAAQSLDSVVNANTQLSPQALIALIETRHELGQAIDIQTAGLAGAYAQEYRKDTLGPELKRVHILALADAGAFDTAFRELELFATGQPEDRYDHLRAQALMTLAQGADDTTFLKYAIVKPDDETRQQDPASAIAVAERLIGLGFPQQAETYLGAISDSTHNNIRRLLRAQAALDQNNPRRAGAFLLGLTGTDADILRAKVDSMRGNHASARRLFAAHDRQEEMIEEAWLASDWDALRDSGDPLWRNAADLAAPASPPGPELGVLAQNRVLIESSAAARNTMEDLLKQMSIDNSP